MNKTWKRILCLTLVLATLASMMVGCGKKKQVEEFTKLENKRLPADIDYDDVVGLRLEAREKLKQIRPENFGQAGRISGVSPADVSVLMIYVESRK